MKVLEIEGVGPAYAAKLEAAGIRSTEELLNRGATASGRKELAGSSGIDAGLILQWVNHADLMRIHGIGSEYSDLLEATGVDTVVELARRNATNLAAAIATENEQKHLTRRVPTESEVTRWIEEAKNLPRMVEY